MSEVKTEIKTISLEELKSRLEAPNAPVLVNVLTEEYFTKKNGARIPGSLWIPLDEVGDKFPKMFNKDREIVVYCGGLQCPQSRMAAEKLVNLGFTHVKAFEGGLEEWSKAGNPLETKDNSQSSSSCCG